jgi:23S rRNA (cytosine1962-C5)-methyltransferase
MKTILLRKNQERRIKAGHPWVFSNEIWKMPERLYPGEDVQVSDSRGHLIGSGFYNPHSLISVRIYSRERREFDRELIKERLKQADDLRQRFYPGSKFYRLCYGESDGLPGLIIDRYDRQLVLEIMSLGTDCRREFVVESLKEQFDPECIYERSDSYSRKLEGLVPAIGELYGRLRPEVTIEENGLKFSADLMHGQKTGWFFDQRDNRAALHPYVRGRTVLDCFCHTGAFAINAAAGGASEVTGMDISESAIKMASKNAGLNGLQQTCRFRKADVMQELKIMSESDVKYDLVILDPPAFAKNKKSVEPALKGYKEINLRAMKLLPRGGILVSCSCSYHIEEEQFRVMLVDAARDAGRTIKLLEFRHQAKDHPVLLASKETQYLKCAFMAIE